MSSDKYNVLSTDGCSEAQASASTNAIAITGAFGGQLNFDGIIVGADALGFSYPLFKFGASETLPSDGSYDPGDAATQKAAYEKIGGGLTITLLKLGI